jgi:hypothetical protein
VPVPCFLLFLCFIKVTQEIFSELDETKAKVPIFPDTRQSPKQRRRGARGQPHHRVARATPWPHHQVVWTPGPPPDIALPPIYSPRRENPKDPNSFPENILQAASVIDARSGGSRSSSRYPTGEGNHHRRPYSSPCLPLGVPNWVPTTHHQAFFWRRCRGERGFLQGESLTSNLFYFIIVLLTFFTLFLFASFYKKYKKISSFIVVIFACLLLVLLEWVLLRTPSCVTLLAQTTMVLSALLLCHLLLRQIYMRLNLIC